MEVACITYVEEQVHSGLCISIYTDSIFRSLCNVFRSYFFQIKRNPHHHTCPSGGGGGKAKTKLAKTRWVADAILDWLRETPTLGSTSLHGKLFDKYKIVVPYMKIFYGKEIALDRINGPWNESFQLLYTFKAEVEAASPGSVVEIEKHPVP